jgi:hypothetical protein
MEKKLRTPMEKETYYKDRSENGALQGSKIVNRNFLEDECWDWKE